MARDWAGFRSELLVAALLVGGPLLCGPASGAASAQELQAVDSAAPDSVAQGAAADESDPTVSAAPLTVAAAVRTLEPPLIDGLNSDAIWRAAPEFSDFRQFAPRADADPSFRTEFQVAFDQDRLYVYVRARDPHPDSIMHALTRRDVRGPWTRSASSSTPTTTAEADSNSS